MMAELATGALFANRFEIELAAGAGGMGTVYRARDRMTGSLVALKVLNPLGKDHKEGDRFAREAQLLAELRHPGIVSYVSHGQTSQGQQYLAMEWLDGNDLNQRLKRGPLSLAESYLLISRIADALELAHQRGIVHRDLNPSNLFLPGDDIARVKLLDFGIARRTAVAHSVTRTGLVIGTPEYMAPEQVRGLRDLTPATDIFALGCVLYKCLTGEPAFSADQIAALLVRILFEEPIPLSQRRPDIPDSVSTLLRRMLQKDPAQRIASAGELLVALGDLGELPEARVSALHDLPSAASGFARSEQVLYSLVVASLLPPGDSGEYSVVVPGAKADPPQERELISELRTLGLRADFLVGGLLVVTVPPSGSANDQAALAARVGLLIKDRWPGAVVAVATGRGESQGGSTVGEVVDRATRLLQYRSSRQLKPNAEVQTGIWLDELSAQLLSPAFTVVAVDNQALLTGEEKEVDASRPLLGKPTPCVGRDAELGMIEGQLLSSIEDSEARVVIVTAAPGIGKSRLRHEFLRRAEKLEVKHSVWLGRGDLMRTGSAYSLIGDAIRRLCGLNGSEAPELSRQQFQERIGKRLTDADASENERVILFMAELCGLPLLLDGNPMLDAARQDPKIMRERIRRAFLDFLTAECAVTPVLLVIDDLHWGDALSVALIDDALRELKNSRLCILAFARPELQQTFAKIWQGHKQQEIQLKGLGRKPCERLVQQILGKQVPAAVVARIVEQSAGNVLFLEELIRALAEGKTDSQSETVLAMLQVRIGRFELGSRRALRAAAVFGQTFWRGGVATVLGVPKTAPEVANWLTALVHGEVIETHSSTLLLDEPQYGFRHGLVRDAAYGLLTDEDRQTGHRLAAEFLEAAGSREPAVIAEHYALGGYQQRAALFYARAAEQALSSSDSKTALTQVERGLGCGADGDTLATLRSVEVAAWRRLNRFDRLYELIPTALPLLRAGTRAWSRTLSVAVLAATLGPPEWRAKVPQLIQLLLGAEPEPDARVAYAEALAFMALALASVAPKAQVQPILTRLKSVVELQAQSSPAFRRWFLWPYFHNVYHREPQPYSTLLGAEEGIRHARIAGDRLIQVSLSISQKALPWFELGDIAGAVRLLRETQKDAEQVDGFVSELTRQTLARVLCEVGDEAALNEAVSLSQAAIDKPGGASTFIGMALHTLARVQIRRMQPAVEQAKRAYQALSGAPLFGVDAATTLITALLVDGRPAEALATVEKALAVIAAFGGAGFAEVGLRLAASEAFHAVENFDRARGELQQTLYQIKMRADDITDPAWKASYLSRNPACVRAQKLAQQWGLPDAAVL